MKIAATLAFLAAVVLAIEASPRPTCKLMDSFPFWKNRQGDLHTKLHSKESIGALKHEIKFKTEYARFFNRKISAMFKEFADTMKQQKRQPKSFNFDEMVEEEGSGEGSGDNPEKPGIGEQLGDITQEIIDTFQGSAQEIIDLFQEIVGSVGDVLQENLPPSFWNAVCVATWWPLEEEHCQESRCAACSPAIMAAASVCQHFQKTGVTHKCTQLVMGEGFCNYCIARILE